MKKHFRGVLLLAVLLFLIGIASARYCLFVSKTMYRESVSHLTEIVHQSNQSLKRQVERNWVDLHLWADYLRDVPEERLMEDFIIHAQREAGFTDFYFLNRDGEYQTVSQKTGYLDLQKEWTQLYVMKEDMVVSSVVPGLPQMMFFVYPGISGQYKDFAYDAIAVSFDNEDMESALKVSAFDGKASSFLVHDDGRILMKSVSGQEKEIYNVLAMLREYSNLSSDQVNEIQRNMKAGKSGAMVLRLEQKKYYLIYESTSSEDWTLFGLVPANLVNSNMNRLQFSGLVMVTGICLVLGGVLLTAVFRTMNRKLRKKDTQILYRDALFSKLSVNVDDVFLMLDALDYRVDYISPNIERVLGVSREEACTDIYVLNRLVGKDEKNYILDQLPGLNPGDQVEWDREYIHQETRELRWFHVIAFCNDIQEEKKYILVLSDRTKEKKVYQALEEAVNVAESANSAKSAFLSNMSHDIRTPMNAIIGYSNLATTNVTQPEKTKEFLLKILSSSKHMLSLINDILDMSRIESGKLYLEESDVNLNEMLQNLKSIISGQINAKQLTLQMYDPDVTNENVICDKTRLNQVLMNLLSNAIKFTPCGGVVTVRCTQLPGAPEGKGFYEFRIRDTGIGMSPEFAKRIFQPFEREKSSMVNKIQGTGLGMTIVKNIVDRMGGSIVIHSEQGVGTEFIITLSLQLQGAATLEERKKEVEKRLSFGEDAFPSEELSQQMNIPLFQGKHVLLVEDNEMNQEISCDLLEDYDFVIDLAEDGKQAVEMIAASKPGDYDIILMDIQMPVMDGYEATRKIRELPDVALASIPIVAMTANAFEEDRRAALECGMNGFIAKPIDMDEVLLVLSEVLRGEP